MVFVFGFHMHIWCDAPFQLCYVMCHGRQLSHLLKVALNTFKQANKSLWRPTNMYIILIL